MPAPDSPRPASLVARFGSYLGLAIGVAGIAFVTRLVVRDWDEITEAVGEARGGLLVVALLFGLSGMGYIGLTWVLLVRRTGARVPLTRALAWYFVGQLGKYVPGGIWPVVGRAELATRAGVGRRVAYTTTATSMFCTYCAAGVVAATLLPAGLGAPAPLAVAAAVVVLAGVAVAFHPAVTGRLLAVGGRLARRPLLLSTPSWRTTLITLGRHVPAWLAITAATWAVARSLDLSVDLLLLAAATPASWLIGFLVIGLPGGLGVRESVFVALMATETTNAQALSVALLARMVFVGVDVVGAAASTLVASAVRAPDAVAPGETGEPAGTPEPTDPAGQARPAVSGTRPAAPVGSPGGDRSGS